ncbi:hypothetical protein PMIN01_03655 [Paraphaeosphaeria minitans]|uniref:Uncharacterized protein n=1 Tax=Paraphaeosphaeria minitans TaxID=565426 RepID=A0A9P6GMG6_9PLEO|nr:hypothetical protein PMIN01_03655 [Paraphaeosphaeria minitans]
MLSCFPVKSRTKSKHQRASTQRTHTIEINANSDNGIHIWKSAAVSYDGSTDENVVSRYLVTEVLKKPIHPVNEEKRILYRTTKDINGYTELVWCVSNSRHVQSTEFFVSSE